MSHRPARAVMAIARSLMRAPERDWAEAMMVEFEQAEQDGDGLRFALGCVTVALRRLTGSSDGRYLLARYGVAVMLLLPMALFHLGCASRGLRYAWSGRDPYLAGLAAGDAGQRAVAVAYRTWAPGILVFLAALGIVHILIAWHIAGGDWRRARRTMIAAVLIVAGLLACIAAVHPSATGIILQCLALVAELLAVPILAAWQARLASSSIR